MHQQPGNWLSAPFRSSIIAVVMALRIRSMSRERTLKLKPSGSCRVLYLADGRIDGVRLPPSRDGVGTLLAGLVPVRGRLASRQADQDQPQS